MQPSICPSPLSPADAISISPYSEEPQQPCKLRSEHSNYSFTPSREQSKPRSSIPWTSDNATEFNLTGTKHISSTKTMPIHRIHPGTHCRQLNWSHTEFSKPELVYARIGLCSHLRPKQTKKRLALLNNSSVCSIGSKQYR